MFSWCCPFGLTYRICTLSWRLHTCHPLRPGLLYVWACAVGSALTTTQVNHHICCIASGSATLMLFWAIAQQSSGPWARLSCCRQCLPPVRAGHKPPAQQQQQHNTLCSVAAEAGLDLLAVAAGSMGFGASPQFGQQQPPPAFGSSQVNVTKAHHACVLHTTCLRQTCCLLKQTSCP